MASAAVALASAAALASAVAAAAVALASASASPAVASSSAVASSAAVAWASASSELAWASWVPAASSCRTGVSAVEVAEVPGRYGQQSLAHGHVPCSLGCLPLDSGRWHCVGAQW